MNKICVARINPGETFQIMAGFGASGAWWAQVVGGWDNAGEIVDLLYDREKGAGLTIFRYNIGAGLPNAAPDPWRRAETLEASPGVYDLERDRNALTVFRMAMERGAARNVLFANSPPARMTVSGRVSGGDVEYVDNLRPECEDDFAAYLVDITALLLDHGFKADYLSPVNEPQWGWGGPGASQEGCHYGSDQALRVGRAVAEELERRGLPVKVSLAESGKWNDRNYTLDLARRIAADDALRDHFDHYAAHSYWSSARDKRAAAAFFARIPGMPPLHQTEWCQMEAGRDLGMDGALALAREVHDDLTILSAASWSWWIAVSPYDYNDGLVYVDPSTKGFTAAKRLWALANYSRFVLPGYTRIDVETDDSAGRAASSAAIPVTAFQSGDGLTTVVVAINDQDVEIPFAVAGFPGSGKSSPVVKMYVTSAERDCRDLYKTFFKGERVALPPRSVTTLVREE